MAKKKDDTAHFYGCLKCGWFKTHDKMIGKCEKCGAKLHRYGTFKDGKFTPAQ